MRASHKTICKVIAECKGARAASIIAHTQQTLTGGKSNPFFGRVTKIAHVNGMINWLYENAVNKQRLREEQPTDDEGAIEPFIAEPRPWGKRLHLAVGEKSRLLAFVHHIKGTKRDGISHKILTPAEFEALPVSELYLELKPQASIHYQYLLDGQPIDEAEIKEFLPDKSNEGKTQGTDTIIRVRDYQLVNIRELALNGKIYRVDTK